MDFAEPAAADRRRLDPARVFAAGLANHHVSNTAYPIAHQTTVAPYRVKSGEQPRAVTRAFSRATDLSVYVHVPFCETRCGFCEYTVVRREEATLAEQYVDALVKEIALYDAALGLGARRVHGFDLGGGTPTWLSLEQIARIAEAVRSTVRLEPGVCASIETTPRIAAREPAKIAGLPGLGFDRISMGVQVADAELLGALGRGNDGAREQLRAAEHIRRAGFARFNVDLMYGFAGQSLAGWRATLEHAVRLGPDAITLYRMRYKLTRISHQAAEVGLDQVQALSELAKQVLADAGFCAPVGKTTLSRLAGEDGTSSYLSRRVRDGLPYLGFGLGAQSFSLGTLAYNAGAAGKNLTPYLRRVASGQLPLQDQYLLPRCQAMAKMCAVSFYFGAIDGAAFVRSFGVELEQAFPDALDFVLQRGLMAWSGRSLCLTGAGLAQLPGVIALFFAPSVQAHLTERSPNDVAPRRGLPLHRPVAEASGV
ncbi:MAG: radical SAM protein [Myxococcales bacterium]|nr:radical SAM protein [Myxococcales bacterium]